ncbi:MAG: uracil-DNA glycosylase, partial [Candidatus Hydrothermarchaeales archaeon]
LLSDLLLEAGINREEIFITSVVKSRPPGNRQPRRGEIKACLPYLERQMAAIKPGVVGILGGVAAKALLGEAKLSGIRGTVFKRDYVFVPTYHPAAVLRNPGLREVMLKDLKRIGSLPHVNP